MTILSRDTPKLRFKDRSGGSYPAWQQYKIGELFDISAGGDVDRSRVSETRDDKHPYPVYANGNTNQGLYGYTDVFRQKGNCITVTGRGNLGIAIARHESFYPIVRLLTLRPRSRIDMVFSEYLINNTNFFIESTGVPQLTGPQISTYKVMIPELSEQESIADFLSAVDKKIDLLEKKKELLEQYKKGVMQQIFSQKIRFKDEAGNDYQDWQKAKLDQFAVVIMGQSPPSDSYNKETFGQPLIQGNADIAGRLSKPRTWTTKPTKMVSKNEILLTVRAPVGHTALSLHNACIGRGMAAIKARSNSLNGFIYQLLLWFEPKWQRLEQGSTFTAISGNDIRNVDLQIPHLEEQQKIAALLHLIDSKVLLTSKKLECLNSWKKGLLQQMFA